MGLGRGSSELPLRGDGPTCWRLQDLEVCSELPTHKGGLKGHSMPDSSSFHFFKVERSQLLYPSLTYFLKRQPMISQGIRLKPTCSRPSFMLISSGTCCLQVSLSTCGNLGEGRNAGGGVIGRIMSFCPLGSLSSLTITPNPFSFT